MSLPGPSLRVKLVVTLILSLVLIDSLAYAVARRQFEDSEMRETHENARALLGAMAARIDERVEDWQRQVEDHLDEALRDDAMVAVTELREHGLEGALFLRAGAAEPAAVANAAHGDQDAAHMIPLALAAPEGIGTYDGHLVVVSATAQGDRLAAWVGLETFDDILTAQDVIALVPAERPRAGSGNGIVNETVALRTLRYALQMEVDHRVAVESAGRLATRFLLASTIALAATGMLAIFVVGRTLAPLARITEAARSLSAPNAPPVKLGIETGDEVQVLAETLEATSAALDEARQREREHAEALRRGEVDSARLAAAAEIERREADHRRVLESLTDCVLVADRQGELLLANPAARMHGFGVGRSLAEPVEPEDAPPLLASIAQATLAASPALRLRTKRGRLLDAEARSITYDDHDAVLLVAADVTDRVRLAAEAEERRDALARSERLSSLGTLVAGVAHEINNPLTYINGNIELALLDLEGDPAKAETAAQLRRALSGTERIAHITQALRAVARQRPTGAKEPVDLVAVARNVEALLRVGLPPKVELELIASREPVRVVGSSTELHQVLLNLVKNAIEAVAEKGGHVRIRCVPLDGEAQLAVEDDGPGLPPGAADRLFTPFYTTKPGGTGLGLSIAQGIARDHGGRIEVRSTPGKGAEFRVLLPLATAEPAKPTPVARSGP